MDPMTAFAIGVGTFLIPLIAIALWSRGRRASLFEEAIRFTAVAALTVLLFLVGPWSFASYYLRYVVLACLAVALVLRVKGTWRRRTEGTLKGKRRVRLGVTALGACVLMGVDAIAIRGLFPPGNPVSLAFPLSGGLYYVLQCGTSPLSSPFHWSGRSGRLALDVTKLNLLGMRAKRLVPVGVEDYAIFGEVIYSPCDGTVVRVRDGLPDNRPGEADAVHPEGNHVVLRCKATDVFLAHMMRGSVLLRAGQRVRQDEPIGRVGNSGNTSEPHLHIQANRLAADAGVLGGEAVAMLLDGRFLSLNSMVIVSATTKRR